MNNKVIFIASLDHSGSTMLDLMLGSHSRIVGLGEIDLTIRHFHGHREHFCKRICSCGEIAEECNFWSEVISRWNKIDKAKYESLYHVILRTFYDIYGYETYLLDSSKYIKALKRIVEVPVNVSVIHLLKDVRAFTISRLDRTKEKLNKYNFLLPFKQYISWHQYNEKMQSFLSLREIKNFRVGYEEICLDTSKIISLLSQFIGISYEENTLSPKDSSSHCLMGNRMRLQEEKLRLIYDSRWFTRTEWMLPSILFKKVMIYNTKNVYSNNVSDLYIRT